MTSPPANATIMAEAATGATLSSHPSPPLNGNGDSSGGRNGNSGGDLISTGGNNSGGVSDGNGGDLISGNGGDGNSVSMSDGKDLISCGGNSSSNGGDGNSANLVLAETSMPEGKNPTSFLQGGAVSTMTEGSDGEVPLAAVSRRRFLISENEDNYPDGKWMEVTEEAAQNSESCLIFFYKNYY